ncbi:MAG TPA: RNA polymerase sigma factor [Gemmatimonadaceae bacterium]|nr:RNA polymerase sigma factor [Gemmatimonadaceae bacterium]
MHLTGPSAHDAGDDLVALARSGDHAAFEQLYIAHSPRVFALCLRLAGGNRVAATALLQDAFIAAWRGLPRFRGDAPFTSWLHRLAVNAMLQNARSDKRRSARVLFMDDSTIPGAESRADRPDISMDLEDAIARLPAGARTAFVLHDIEGYQHNEIAEQLGVAVGTVKAQVHRARGLLMKSLNR